MPSHLPYSRYSDAVLVRKAIFDGDLRAYDELVRRAENVFKALESDALKNYAAPHSAANRIHLPPAWTPGFKRLLISMLLCCWNPDSKYAGTWAAYVGEKGAEVLLALFAQAGNPVAEALLVELLARRAHGVFANSFRNIDRGHRPMRDWMETIARGALLKALGGFDVRKGLWLSYVLTILRRRALEEGHFYRGDFLNDKDRAIERRINEAWARLIQENPGVEPSDEQLCAAAGITRDQFDRYQARKSFDQQSSLDDPDCAFLLDCGVAELCAPDALCMDDVRKWRGRLAHVLQNVGPEHLTLLRFEAAGMLSNALAWANRLPCAKTENLIIRIKRTIICAALARHPTEDFYDAAPSCARALELEMHEQAKPIRSALVAAIDWLPRAIRELDPTESKTVILRLADVDHAIIAKGLGLLVRKTGLPSSEQSRAAYSRGQLALVDLLAGEKFAYGLSARFLFALTKAIVRDAWSRQHPPEPPEPTDPNDPTPKPPTTPTPPEVLDWLERFAIEFVAWRSRNAA